MVAVRSKKDYLSLLVERTECGSARPVTLSLVLRSFSWMSRLTYRVHYTLGNGIYPANSFLFTWNWQQVFPPHAQLSALQHLSSHGIVILTRKHSPSSSGSIAHPPHRLWNWNSLQAMFNREQSNGLSAHCIGATSGLWPVLFLFYFKNRKVDRSLRSQTLWRPWISCLHLALYLFLGDLPYASLLIMSQLGARWCVSLFQSRLSPAQQSLWPFPLSFATCSILPKVAKSDVKTDLTGMRVKFQNLASNLGEVENGPLDLTPGIAISDRKETQIDPDIDCDLD